MKTCNTIHVYTNCTRIEIINHYGKVFNCLSLFALQNFVNYSEISSILITYSFGVPLITNPCNALPIDPIHCFKDFFLLIGRLFLLIRVQDTRGEELLNYNFIVLKYIC